MDQPDLTFTLHFSIVLGFPWIHRIPPIRKMDPSVRAACWVNFLRLVIVIQGLNVVAVDSEGPPIWLTHRLFLCVLVSFPLHQSNPHQKSLQVGSPGFFCELFQVKKTPYGWRPVIFEQVRLTDEVQGRDSSLSSATDQDGQLCGSPQSEGCVLLDLQPSRICLLLDGGRHGFISSKQCDLAS